MNLGDIPAKIAANSPAREALVDVPNDRRISYGELEDRVSRLANSLRGDLGLKKGDRVAILSRNCIQYMEIMFAAARCGLIALPLNWRLSEPEMPIWIWSLARLSMTPESMVPSPFLNSRVRVKSVNSLVVQRSEPAFLGSDWQWMVPSLTVQ